MKSSIEKPRIFYILISVILLFYSCQKDYITGGEIEDVNRYSGVSTYDALSTMPQFDTLIQIIDAAGMKDAINRTQSTFFAPSDAVIYNYLESRTIHIQATVDQFAKFTLDSLKYHLKNNISGIADSLKMYLIPQQLEANSELSTTGVFYRTELANDSAIVSYEYTYSDDMGYSDLVSTVPKILYYTHLWKPYNLDDSDSTAADIPSETGVHTLVTTSFIKTKNGVVNVLTPGSTLFFYGTKVNQ